MITFHELYERYAPDVYRFSFWLAGNAMDAEDITSETFVRAWTSKREIRMETLKGYLLTIARHVFLEQLRKEKRQVVLEDVHSDPQPGPERQVAAHLAWLQVRQAISQLPEVDRTAFVLRVEHELPYEEIARVLGVSLTAVKVKVHRVRLKLAAAHGEEANA